VSCVPLPVPVLLGPYPRPTGFVYTTVSPLGLWEKVALAV